MFIINDIIEKNRIKSYFNRAKRKITDFDFELIKEFEDTREALNFIYENDDIDIIIAENSAEKVFSGLDLIMLAENEFPQTSIILLTEAEEKLKLDFENISNLTAVLNKRESYSSFSNLLLLTILKQKEKRKKFRKKEQKLNDYRTIIDHTHDAIFLLTVDCDENFYYKRINGTHQRLTALNNEEIKGKKAGEIFNKDIAAKLEENYRKCLRKKESINYTEVVTVPAGKKTWQTTLYPVVRNGRVEEIVGASYDITELEAKQQRFDYIKRHDKLTGLYNKEYFIQLFTELNQNQQTDLALLLLNIENFHLVKKIFGYQQGNKILKEIGSILGKITDKDKIAAHLCSDHFAVILKNKNSTEIQEILNFIKKEINKININNIYLDTAVVSMQKINKNISSYSFINDGISKINFKKYKSTKESRFYQSLLEYLEADDYKELRQNRKLLAICKETAEYFNLNQKDTNKLLLLAKHHDIGKLALNKNIVKKGEELTAEEWHEYQKHTIVSANFAAYYSDLAGLRNLIYYHHEHFDGSGWPEGLKEKEIPYLNRLFSVVNFYSNLKTNFYFPLFKDKFYFAELEKNEIIKEITHYRGKIFDPIIVDKFLTFIEKNK